MLLKSVFLKIAAIISISLLISACDSPNKQIKMPHFYKGNDNSQNIRGIYVGASDRILSMINIAKKLSANAMVIDVKNDMGEITCDLEIPYKEGISIKKNVRIQNIRGVLKTLKKNGIYTIARIVAFKDQPATESMPEIAVKNKDGSVLKDKEGSVWINPYNKKTWEYVVNIAKGAAIVGFSEIQFDYVRFSPFKNVNVDLGEISKTVSREEIINQFFDFAIKELKPFNVKISVDVFGCIIPETLGEDTIISTKMLGQNYEKLSEKLDFICPMIYPSHYPVNSMNIKYPDLEPYKIIYSVTQKAMESNEKNKKSKAVIRPWLQAFTASWLPSHVYQKYTKTQLYEQIQATYDAGIGGWCLWNPSARYNVFLD